MSTIEEDEIRKDYMKGNLRVILIEMLSSQLVWTHVEDDNDNKIQPLCRVEETSKELKI